MKAKLPMGLFFLVTSRYDKSRNLSCAVIIRRNPFCKIKWASVVSRGICEKFDIPACCSSVKKRLMEMRA